MLPRTSKRKKEESDRSAELHNISPTIGRKTSQRKESPADELRITAHYLSPNVDFPSDHAWFIIHQGNMKPSSVNGKWIAEKAPKLGVSYIEKHCLKKAYDREHFEPWLEKMRNARDTAESSSAIARQTKAQPTASDSGVNSCKKSPPQLKDTSEEYQVSEGGASMTPSNTWRAQLYYSGRSVNLRTCTSQDEARQHGAIFRRILQSYHKTKAELKSMSAGGIEALVQDARDILRRKLELKDCQDATKKRTLKQSDRKEATKKQKNDHSESGTVFKEPEIGDRVYSRYGNDGWYWGMVTNKFRKGGELRFSIRYEDGDFIEEFDPKWGVATDALYRSGMVYCPGDSLTRATKSDFSKPTSVQQKDYRSKAPSRQYIIPKGCVYLNKETWVVQTNIAGKSRYLRAAPTKNDGWRFLKLFRSSLQSFRKTNEEVDRMSEDEIKSLLEDAKAETEESLLLEDAKEETEDYIFGNGSVYLAHNGTWRTEIYCRGTRYQLGFFQTKEKGRRCVDSVCSTLQSFRKSKAEVKSMTGDEIRTMIDGAVRKGFGGNRSRLEETTSEEKKIGDRVYSRYHNGYWYWGTVTNKFKKNRKLYYSIMYDDGDFIEKFDPQLGIATEAENRAGVIPRDPVATAQSPNSGINADPKTSCGSIRGSVDQYTENLWRARLSFVGRNRIVGEFDSSEEAMACLKAVKERVESIGLTSHQRKSMPEMKARAIFDDVISEVATAESKVNSNHAKDVNDLRLLKQTQTVVDREKSIMQTQAIPSESCTQIGGLPRGQVRQISQNSWKAAIFYAGKYQHLGRFRTENEASGYLSAVRVKLESYQQDQESQSFIDKAKAEARKTLLLSKNLDPLNLQELYQTRCDHCMLCRKEDCKRCEPCIRNLENMQDGNKQICLRKMCCNIEAKRKAQPAVGFPPGWRFVFDAPGKKIRTNSIQGRPVLDGLKLLSATGMAYKSLNAAFNHNPVTLNDVESISMAFLKHVGQPRQNDQGQHILVGRRTCEQWSDVHSRNKIVYGIITGYSEDNDDNSFFNVKYNAASKSVANLIPNECGCSVPNSRSLKPEFAWGGCLLYEDLKQPHLDCKLPLLQSISAIDKHCWRWIVPDLRYEELETFGGKRVPKLTLVVRGHQIVFSVRQSTIPFAGYGVFVKAKNCMGDSDAPLDFQRGELLDLGVYAPFLSTDKKKEAVFCAKTYIHSYAPEEWCFESDAVDTMYDITDDHSGSISEQARRHIPSYINECNNDGIPTVRAELDPEGAVHYLLGVIDEKETRMSIPTNGEKEVFVHYGERYENVRLRKGYSQLGAKEKQKRMKELEGEDSEHLDDIERNYSVENVTDCVDYLESLYSDNSQSVSPLVRERSHQILSCLQKRCQTLLELEEADDMGGLELCADKIQDLRTQLVDSGPATKVLDYQEVDETLINENFSDIETRFESSFVQDGSTETPDLIGLESPQQRRLERQSRDVDNTALPRLLSLKIGDENRNSRTCLYMPIIANRAGDCGIREKASQFAKNDSPSEDECRSNEEHTPIAELLSKEPKSPSMKKHTVEPGVVDGGLVGQTESERRERLISCLVDPQPQEIELTDKQIVVRLR